MTWEQLMLEQLGYECKTTFWNDFSIADKFGAAAVKGTYKRSFDSWKDNVVYITELVLVLNHKIWYWYEKNDELSRLYNDLWMELDEWCGENLKGKDAEYYYRVTD